MKVYRFVLFALLVSWAVASKASQDLFVPVRVLSIEAQYEISPDLLSSLPCFQQQTCDFETYRGSVELEAETSESEGKLTKFELRIGGQEISNDLVETLSQWTEVHLGGVGILHSPTYTPQPLRGEILPAVSPYILIRTLTGVDPGCEFGGWVSLHFGFEGATLTVRKGCIDPAEGFVD